MFVKRWYSRLLSTASLSVFLAVALLVFAKPAWGQQTTPAQGTGVITGTVVNGTTGQPVPGLTVNLSVFDKATALENRSTTTDATGAYNFTDLSTDPTLAYVAQVEYPAGFHYNSEIASFAAGQDTLNLPVSVYETTTDSAGVRVDQAHFIVEFEPSQVLVTEMLVFSLDGNRTYRGDDAGVLHFTLPPDAQGLQFSGGKLGERYQLTENGFVDTLALPPGKGVRQVLFSYVVPYSDDALDLVRTLPYPAANVNVLVSDVGERVTSPDLTNLGVRSTANGDYINLNTKNLPANQAITLHFTNLSSATASKVVSGTTRGDQRLLIVLAALAGLGATLLVVWPLLRRRATAGGALVPSGEDQGTVVRDERGALVAALARLEAAYEAGEIPEAEYRDRRLRLKAQLSDLT